MTIAISEILKQTELLSAAEQEELAHKLLERTRQRQASQHHPPSGATSAPPAQVSATSQDDEEAQDDFITDVFSLNRVPPKRTYMARATFRYVGRGKPRPYELDADLLEVEESSEGEAG